MGISKFIADRVAYNAGFQDALKGDRKSWMLQSNASYSEGYSDGMQERMTKGMEGESMVAASNDVSVEDDLLDSYDEGSGTMPATLSCYGCGKNFPISLLANQKIDYYENAVNPPSNQQIRAHDRVNRLRTWLGFDANIAWWQEDWYVELVQEKKESSWRDFRCPHCGCLATVFFEDSN